jgi:hypothetical protein
MAVSPTSDLLQSTIAEAQDRVTATTRGTPEWQEAQRAAIEVRRAFWDEMRRTWRPKYPDRNRREPSR